MTNNTNNKKIILLVDDEKDILNLYYECLQSWGYQTISFDNPKEALNYIDKNISDYPSLIITDYKMPEMNGIDFIKQIREKYSSSNFSLKIMLISAFMKNDLNVQDTVNNLNIDKIIEKPIRLELFKEEVEKLMDKQQEQPFQIYK
jgi:response regulator RpfG family c-di-GMP phosphodiesterase